MLYCPGCQVLCQGERCPSCGGGKLRQPQGNDPVLLMTADELECGRITAVLEEHQIPYEERICGLEARPAAYFGPQAAANKNIFVPYSALDHCRSLLCGIGILEEPDREDADRKETQKADLVEQPTSPLTKTGWRIFSVLLFLALVWAVVAISDSLFRNFRSMLGF